MSTNAKEQTTDAHQDDWQIIIDGKQHLRSKNAGSAIKRRIRALIDNHQILSSIGSTAASWQSTAASLQQKLQNTPQLQEYASDHYTITFNVAHSTNTIALVIKQSQSIIDKKKLKDKLQQLKQQRTRTHTTHTSSENSSINKAYKKLITTLNQQPQGDMLTKLIPVPQKLSEASPEELKMQTMLFESLPMNNQLKRLILNYFNSANQ